jgi:hypothetical protein
MKKNVFSFAASKLSTLDSNINFDQVDLSGTRRYRRIVKVKKFVLNLKFKKNEQQVNEGCVVLQFPFLFRIFPRKISLFLCNVFNLKIQDAHTSFNTKPTKTLFHFLFFWSIFRFRYFSLHLHSSFYVSGFLQFSIFSFIITTVIIKVRFLCCSLFLFLGFKLFIYVSGRSVACLILKCDASCICWLMLGF